MMQTNQQSDFYRPYNLPVARKYSSKKEPAAHQSEALNKLQQWFGQKLSPAGGILVLPTGGGKTFTATRFLCTQPLSEGYKVLWLAHTHYLLEQAFYSFGPKEEVDQSHLGCEVGRISGAKQALNVRVVSGTVGHFKAADIKATDDVVIGTLQTLTRAYQEITHFPQLDAFLRSTNGKLCVVFDEAHHAPANSYQRLISKLRQDFPEMYLLGLTATPTYEDESKAGWLKQLFPQEIIYQVGIQKLIADRILAKPIQEEFRTDITPEFDEATYRKWIGQYKDLPPEIISQLALSEQRNAFIAKAYADNKQRYGKTIIFASRWFQCEQLREFLIKRNVRADVMYCKTDVNPGTEAARNARDKTENDRVLAAFRQNELDVVINVKMLTEGIDVPDAQTVFITRQTRSTSLLTQMVGRALRGPRFGGKDNAYIVSFVDDWKQAINWAEYELPGGGTKTTRPPYTDGLPMQWLSIALVRQLAEQMQQGIDEVPAPFITLLPLGWYRLKFEAFIPENEDCETINQLVMVFEHERAAYECFIKFLLKEDIEVFAEPVLDFHTYVGRFERWQLLFFDDVEVYDGGNLIKNLFYITRHIAQNDGKPPQFFEFEQRQEHDLDQLAQEGIDYDWGPQVIEQKLQEEYERENRYWQVMYPAFRLFRSQYYACRARIMDIDKRPIEPLPPIINKLAGEGIRDAEPSKEVKESVKKQDQYRCLCCGAMSKLQVDHIKARYHGGSHLIDNLQTLCHACNREKGTKEISFRERRSHLRVKPSAWMELKFPGEADGQKRWEQFLRRSINFFYQCAAVSAISSGNTNRTFDTWQINLHTGNEPTLIKPYLNAFTEEVYQRRKRAGHATPKKLVVVASY